MDLIVSPEEIRVADSVWGSEIVAYCQMLIEVILTRLETEHLLQMKRLRVGWSNCRIKLKIQSEKCFKSQGFGHITANCDVKNIFTDSKNICMRCNKKGHVVKRFKKKPRCLLCEVAGITEVDHLSGDEKCLSKPVKAK